MKNERGRGTNKVSKRSTDDERRGRNRDARASDHRARERPSTSTASKEGDRWTRRSASRDDTPHRPQSPVGLDEKREIQRARATRTRDTPRRKMVRNVTRHHPTQTRASSLARFPRRVVARFSIPRFLRKTSLRAWRERHPKSAQNDKSSLAKREKSPTRGARVARATKTRPRKKGRARKKRRFLRRRTVSEHLSGRHFVCFEYKCAFA